MDFKMKEKEGEKAKDGVNADDRKLLYQSDSGKC